MIDINKIEVGDVINVIKTSMEQELHITVVTECEDNYVYYLDEIIDETGKAHYWMAKDYSSNGFVKLVMKGSVLKALKESIQAYKAGKISIYSPSCPLCILLDIDCYLCPVYQKTGLLKCRGTPWIALADHCEGRHSAAASHPDTCWDCRRLQDEEMKFLESLLPANCQGFKPKPREYKVGDRFKTGCGKLLMLSKDRETHRVNLVNINSGEIYDSAWTLSETRTKDEIINNLIRSVALTPLIKCDKCEDGYVKANEYSISRRPDGRDAEKVVTDQELFFRCTCQGGYVESK